MAEKAGPARQLAAGSFALVVKLMEHLEADRKISPADFAEIADAASASLDKSYKQAREILEQLSEGARRRADE